MIGRIEFIKCAGSLVTGEHVLLISDSEIDDYIVQTYSDVVFVEDIQQTVTMPSFDGWSECNMVRLTQTNQAEGKTAWKAYYWITDAMRASDVAGATVFNLEFNPIASMVKKGDSVKGQWLRSPVNYTPWKQQNVVSGTYAYSTKTVEFPTMPTSDYLTEGGYDVYWVSITATHSPDGKQGTLEVYGFPCAVKSRQALCDGTSWPLYYYDTDGGKSPLPTLWGILNGVTYDLIGLTTDEITDISITRSDPFGCTMTDIDSGTGITQCVFTMAYGLQPVKVKTAEGTEAAAAMYHLTGYSRFPTKATYMVLTLEPFETACASVDICDVNGATIASIPTSWGTLNEDGTTRIDIVHSCIVDIAQCYDRLTVVDSTGTETLGIFQIPAGHIPYVGSTWDSYRAYSMSSDREAMQFTIDQAKTAMIANVADAGINLAVGVATGGASIAAKTASLKSTGATQAQITYANTAYQGQQQQAGASAGTGIIGSIVGGYQQMQAAEFNQKLAERRTKVAPGNAYNTNYGLSYILNQGETPNRIVVSMPAGLTEAKFNEFVENFGYANEGEYTQELTYGFYQGTVYSSPTKTGPRFNELINAFNAGIRLIPPTGNE